MKVAVEGMSCEHCVARIRGALSELGAVLVAADLAKGEIEVDLRDVAFSQAAEAISDLGFEARQL